MKKLSKLLVLIFTLTCVNNASVNAQTLKFKLTGNITDTEKGDTLRFNKVTPTWEIEPGGFDVIIGANGKIKYNGKHDHTQYYGATYHPVNGEKITLSNRWLPVIIKDGSTKIIGSKENIYMSTLQGGIYDTELQKALHVNDSLNILRSNIYVKTTKAYALKDIETAKLYEEKFNSFYSTKSVRENNDRYKKMMKAYKKNNQNEYVICDIAMRTATPLNELKQTYDTFSPEVKESHYGQMINKTITELEVLAPGRAAPDFTLVTTKGDTITLEMFKGKYLLIYNFGMCPGSLQIDKYVADLHNKFNDKVTVIGYTDALEPIQTVYNQTKDGEKAMGMDMKSILHGMLNHPWEHEVEGKASSTNLPFLKDYNITGLPHFVVISPEGKIIIRSYDYREVVNAAFSEF